MKNQVRNNKPKPTVTEWFNHMETKKNWKLIQQRHFA